MEGTLFLDPQAAVPACFCPRCGGECYSPTFTCIRCELSETYREAAKPLRVRLKQLRMELVTETNPQIAFCLKNRIAQMAPILTQLNELADLTEHYYDRGYWRNEKYTQ